MNNFFLRDTGLKFVVESTNGVAKIFKAFKVVSREKKFFPKIGNFLTFFAYPGSQISWKMTNFFLRDTGLKFFVDYTNGVTNEL